MRTTLYLATARGLMVVRGAGENWRGEVCLEEFQIQCVAVDPSRNGVVYCGTFGRGIFRSEDGGRKRSALSGLKEPNVMALAVADGGRVYAGTELSAIYQSDDRGETWDPLRTLMTLTSATTWSFPPRPETHHVQSILPSLARRDRLHVAIEAGALVRSDDAGATWCDRVSSSPKDTHSLAVHSQDPTRLHSAAGDGYFESVNDGESWRRMTDGLDHQYCWSVAVSFRDPTTLLLTASKSAYGAHYTESAESFVYRRSGNNAWQLLSDGLPSSQGSRIAVVAASHVEPGIFYCSSEGRVYRSADDGVRWREPGVQWNSGTHTEHAIDMAITEER
jgi:photosystem II stability/assembly factor-like uncharacterized protein